jgi:hypothetical protein
MWDLSIPDVKSGLCRRLVTKLYTGWNRAAESRLQEKCEEKMERNWVVWLCISE